MFASCHSQQVTITEVPIESLGPACHSVHISSRVTAWPSLYAINQLPFIIKRNLRLIKSCYLTRESRQARQCSDDQIRRSKFFILQPLNHPWDRATSLILVDGELWFSAYFQHFFNVSLIEKSVIYDFRILYQTITMPDA